MPWRSPSAMPMALPYGRRSDDRVGTRDRCRAATGRGGGRMRRRRLPAGGVRAHDAEAPPDRRRGLPALAPDHARRRHAPVRFRKRRRARAVPDVARRPGGWPEGCACGAVGRQHRRTPERNRRRRREALPGGARNRQAHRRADHRRAAREGRGGGGDRDHTRRRSAFAGARRPRRARLLAAGGGAAARCRRRRVGRRADRGCAPCESRGMSDRIRTPGIDSVDVEEHRLHTPVLTVEDELDQSLRPRKLSEFVGQASVKEQLEIFIDAAKRRGEALDHVLLAGPPGLGKTSLAQIVASELEVPFVHTAGPTLERKGDVAAYLTALSPRSVFFVDEIHRLQPALEETFYPAMEDRKLPITVGQGAGASVVTLNLPEFTLIGATTRAGLLTTPLRDRFGVTHRLDLYDTDDLAHIVTRSAGILGASIDQDGAATIARRSRGTPRVANRLLKRVRDFAEVRPTGAIDSGVAAAALDLLEIDEEGLDRLDREILSSIVEKFDGGPVGLSTLAVVVSEEEDTLEDVYEPYLLQKGFIKRTPRGRVATSKAYVHLGLRDTRQPQGLF